MNEVLPIGSVIKMKNHELRLLIVGHEYKEKETVYDYVCTSQSKGITYRYNESNNNIVLVNEEDIEEVDFIGYIDETIRNRLLYIKTVRTMRKEKRK